MLFFSGNTIIHELTTKYANSLYIRIEKLQDHMVKFAHYSSFSLSNETDGFRLSLGSYSGNASKFKTCVRHTCIRWIVRRYYAICWGYLYLNINSEFTNLINCSPPQMFRLRRITKDALFAQTFRPVLYKELISLS